MKRRCTLILLVITSLVANAQWQITAGPTEPNVSTLEANDSLLLAGCSSASSSKGGYRTFDSGNNWTSIGITSLSKFSSFAINPSNGTIYAGGNASFYQSFDNGATFTNTNNGLAPYTTKDIFIDGANIYACNQGIYLSTNGGFNWSLISPSISAVKMDKSGNNIIVATLNTGIYYSSDNGSTWTNFTSGLLTNIRDVKIVGTNFFAATENGLFISSDGGTTWTITNLTISTQCIYELGSTLFVGCNGDGVYYSNDGGNSWIVASTGLLNMTVLSLTSNSEYLFAGTTGYVFRRPLSEFGLLTSFLNQNNMNYEIIVAPNPSSGVFSINQNNSLKLDIEIHNAIGELIEKTTSASLNTKIDLSNLSKGIYFIQITDVQKNIFNKKVIIN